MRPDEVRIAVEAAVLGPPELAALDARKSFPGGAAVGRVVAAGDAATHLRDHRVLVGPVGGCGECDVCRRAVPAGCPQRERPGIEIAGALAGSLVARSRWVCALTGPLEGLVPGPEAAALPREASLAYEMIARSGVAPGDVTWWLGGGAVAAFGAELARGKGATAFELSDEERALPPEALLGAARARSAAAGHGAGPWRVFEVSARAVARRRAAALATPGSTVALATAEAAGAQRDDVPDNLFDADVTVLGVAAGHPDLVPEVCALAAKGELDLASAVEIHPASELDALVAALRAGALTRLPIVTFPTG